MNLKLKKILERRDRRTWFYYHLKRDEDFKAEAAKLRTQIAIETAKGHIIPASLRDYEIINDSEKDRKTKLVEKFLSRWNITWDYSLLNHLITEDEDDLPPMFKVGFVVGTNRENNMFDVQIPMTVEHEDLEYLWLMLKAAKKEAGVDITKKPHKVFNRSETGIAYDMWKMRRDELSWPKIANEINKKYPRKHIFDTKSAQRFLKTNGYPT